MTFNQLKLPLAVGIGIFSWACAWVAIRPAVAHISPEHVALGRYLVASLVLLPFWLWRRPKIEKRDLLLIFVMGVCGFTIYNLCINHGEKTITAGAAALIASTIPIFSTLSASIFLHEVVPKPVWRGIWISLAGVMLISFSKEGGVGLSPGAFLVVLAALCAAAYGTLQKSMLTRYNALDLTTAAIWCGTIVLLPYSPGLWSELKAAPHSALGCVVFLGVFPGAIGYVLWSYAQSKMPVASLMSFLLLVPAISILLGWIFLQEFPPAISLVGGAIAISGVIYTNTQKKSQASSEVAK